MSAERDELRRATPGDRRPWPPAWFGAGVARRRDTAVRAEELLHEGFGRPDVIVRDIG